MNTEMKPKDAMRALECCCINQDCYGCPMFSEEPIADCNYYVMSCALALLREKDTEIERLNKEVNRLSQVVLYNDGMMVDTIKEFAQIACDRLRTGNMFMDKSIPDIINNIADEMLEELK